MTVLVIGLVSLAAYLFAGGLIARAFLPSSWEIARRDWYVETTIRASVKTQTVCMALFWLVLAPARLVRCLVSGRLDAAIDGRDPKARERALRERESEAEAREQRIAQLERELGIGRLPESPDLPKTQKYPARICTVCDGCGIAIERTCQVSDDMDGAARFEVARTLLRREGWACDSTGDRCPACKDADDD